MTPNAAAYWEARAVRFGHLGHGLPAVCSYGMPQLYNETIHACQRQALRPWLRSCRDMDVLDVGCGVGRWSLRLAERHNRVLGLDLSPRMVELAQARARERDLDCEFAVGDVVSVKLARRFDLILVVTVLQHLTEDADLRMAVHNLSRLLKPSGSLVLLEAAPNRHTSRCDSPMFRTRTLATYTALLRDSNFASIDVIGVDMAPLRPMLLAANRILPTSVFRGLVTASALLSLPIDLAASRYFPQACWHKVIVAKRSAVTSDAG